ncbi:MAG: hypothetical protein OXR66_05100 [Candidatus Woesearchaeota archaeon]|nr:hypothetical protein [Candidatus Woesearchaeota archaeon]
MQQDDTIDRTVVNVCGAVPQFSMANEHLPSIMYGVRTRESQKILAVLGGGDQAFALLSLGSTVVGIDGEYDAVNWVRARANCAREGNYEGFLAVHAPCASERWQKREQRRREFFSPKRFARIRANIDNLQLVRTLFQKLPRELHIQYDSIYLSNILGWVKGAERAASMRVLQDLVNMQPRGGRVYSAVPEVLDIDGLKFCATVSERVRNAHKVSPAVSWKPSVYRKH